MGDPDLVPILETDRLILRGHRIEDYPESASMWADAAVVAHISGIPSTSEQSWARLLRYAGHWHHMGYGFWAVTSKADGSFLGEVGIADNHRASIPEFDGKPEAGWVFTTRAQGQGFATEAAAAMLDWADANLDHTHTSAMFDPTYAASVNLARKLGYADEVLGRYDGEAALFMFRARRMPPA